MDECTLLDRDRASLLRFIIRHQSLILAVHQRRGDHEIRRRAIARNRYVPNYGHPQESLDVGVMRLRFERIPEKDQEIDFTLDDLGPYLLISPQGAALELGDVEAKLLLQNGTGRTGRIDLVVSKEIAIEARPFYQVVLLVVVSNQRDLLVWFHRELLVGHIQNHLLIVRGCRFLSFAGEKFGYFVPIDNIPEGSEVFGPAVLILQIIRVFPHVDAEDRNSLHIGEVHHWIILIGRGSDCKLSVLLDEPGPARSESVHTGPGELLLKLFERSEIPGDGRRQVAGGCPSPFRFHPIPEQRVIVMSPPVISYRDRKLRNTGKDLFDGFLIPFRPFDRLIQIGYICRVMLSVMNLHGHLIDGGLKGISRIRQVGKCKWHG